jgi:uncharacterized protein
VFFTFFVIFHFNIRFFNYFTELDKKGFLFNIIGVMELQINVENLPQDGSRIDIYIKEENVSAKEITGDVHVNALVHKSGNSYDVQGFEEYNLRLTCSRCLQEIIQYEKRNFHLEFKKKAEYNIDVRLPREADQTEIEYIVENNCIDLGSFLRDEIILSVPMKPLCSEECKGLCPICGANLNNTTCKHSKLKEKSLT